MTLDYFYGQAGELFSFFRIPKALFQEQRFQNLSTDAKTLYGILLDRMSLSVKNEWFDKKGRVFIIFTIEDVKRTLRCADNKATRLLRELEEFGLIERKRRGQGKPCLVYVKNFSAESSKESVKNRDNDDSCGSKIACQDPVKSRGIKKKENKTEMNNTNPILSDEIEEMKNAKKYRHGMEYGSARWGTAKDIEPFQAPKFADNIILTKTERLMMSNRPPDPKNARNKNVLVVGGSGSGKTRFWLKPNLLQCHSSYVVTDPKGTIVLECGQAMLKNGYKVKILNTINFKKSMHYNPFSYVHSEKDILKLVTTLMTNTKGEGSGGDPFWEKSERLLLTALIAYLHYEAPVEEQNFATLLEMLNTMQVLEDDEEYQNPVDLLFEELAKKKPNSFAGRQYKLYKLAAGDICSK